MDKNGSFSGKIIAGILILLVLAGIGYLTFHNTSSIGTGNVVTNQNNTANTTNAVKLSDTQYWSYAHLISSDTLDDNTKTALSGFNLQKSTLSDGSQNITLVALNSQYRSASFIVKPGQQLYFIETSLGDDSPPSGEYSLGDDTAVLVDSNGYIIQ